MEKNYKELNLWQKMSLATEKIEKVKKDLKIEIGKTKSYNAVSELSILNAVKKVEAELGIYSYPMTRQVIDRDILTTTREYNGTTTESNQLFMRVETRYFFVNIDKPEESLQVMSYGDGIDSGDKASGKAMTYADKYALMKAYKIETGEDPDKEESAELKTSKSMIEKRNDAPISVGQLTLLNKWASTDERKTDMLNKLTVMCNRSISSFEDLKLVEASNYIKMITDIVNKKKEENKNA